MDIPVKITDKALKEIKQIFDHKNIPQDYGVRVGVQGGGCAGVNYILGFDECQDNDITFEDYGVKVFINKKDVMHLLGKEVDFMDEHNQRGFFFCDVN